ncbi:hypothetical protein LPJ53_001163 [Coemansia erecta]|uniref:Metallo-beta-lactamase domain-containing protein n=1 Tax=Coemansia erecta TaxID=147472 RepID=A0A9W8CUV1_9FUNG|nr:hypothetical protein LPJ53_001163 [Coemansia erecta]
MSDRAYTFGRPPHSTPPTARPPTQHTQHTQHTHYSSHVSSADSICSFETDFLPRMSNTIGRSALHAANPLSPRSSALADTGARLRRGLRGLKQRLPLASRSADWRDEGAMNAEARAEYHLPRSLRPSSMFHLRVQYDGAASDDDDDDVFSASSDDEYVSPLDIEPSLKPSEGPASSSLSPAAPGDEQKFSFSPSLASLARRDLGDTCMAENSAALQGGGMRQRLVLSYDAGGREGGLRSMQTAIDGFDVSITCCCCCTTTISTAMVSSSSEGSRAAAARALVSPLHSLVPSFTGSAHFVHTEAGPALGVGAHGCACQAGQGLAAEGGPGESPLSLMRIRLRPRRPARPTTAAAGAVAKPWSSGGSSMEALPMLRASRSTCLAQPQSEAQMKQAWLAAPEYLRVPALAKSSSTPAVQPSESRASSHNHLLLSGIAGIASSEAAEQPPLTPPPPAERAIRAIRASLATCAEPASGQEAPAAAAAAAAEATPQPMRPSLTDSDALSFRTARSSLRSAGGSLASLDALSSPDIRAARLPEHPARMPPPLPTPRSVPVVEQARRARHPVYRFGALANETFEAGRHQDAFDLYSWALLLLAPPRGQSAADLLAKPDVRRELGRLGWRCGEPPESPAEHGGRAEPSPPPPPPAKRPSWRPFARWRSQPPQPAERPQAIDEPLPMSVALARAGRYEFSAALLAQMPARAPAPDAWAMPAGDERRDVCALLHSNRSAAAYALGKYLAAQRDALRAAELRPAWAKGHFRLGEALLALGRTRPAHASLRRAVGLAPHDLHVRVACERARILAHNDHMGLRVVQLLAGRDFAQPMARAASVAHPVRAAVFRFAGEMRNFAYVVGDARSRKCVVVDACWDVDAILRAVARERLLLAAAVVTHAHVDHAGGVAPPPFASLRIRVAGVAELKRRMPHLPLLVHPLDIPEILAANGSLEPRHFTPTPNGFAFRLGAQTDLRFLHTPGHTPGSQCLLVNGCRLFSGDTLFPGACGRTDLRGGSREDMAESLRSRLAGVADSTVVYPGHEYGGEWTSIGRERKRGVMRLPARERELLNDGRADERPVDAAAAALAAAAAAAAATVAG